MSATKDEVTSLQKGILALAKNAKELNGVIAEMSLALQRNAEIIHEQVKQEMITAKQEIENSTVLTAKSYIDATIGEKMNERGISKFDADRLTKLRNKRLIELLGSPGSDNYILFIKYYQGMLRNSYKNHFKVLRYGDITPAQYKEAEMFIKSFDISDTKWMREKLEKEYLNGELTVKQRNAYERCFGKKNF